MLKTIKKFVTSLSIASLLFIPVLAPALAHAAPGDSTNPNVDINTNLCQGANLDVKNPCDATDPGSKDKINTILADIINIFSLVVGVVAVIMIIIGGLKYITSGGESSNISGAKNTILYAVIGLVIVALAQFIVRFVLNKVAS